MPNTPPMPQPPPRPSKGHLILPVAALGLLVACIGVWMHGSHPVHTISHVQRAIREIALAGAVAQHRHGAGVIGPWRIAADEVDPITGEYRRFRVDSGSMLIGAERATLLVDPEADTFSFEMWDVTFTRVPERRESDGDDSYVWTMAHHVLGPAPYGMDIVPDRKTAEFQTPGSESPSVVSAE